VHSCIALAISALRRHLASSQAQAAYSKRTIATLAGGCFWCLEAVYDEVNGVLSVGSGYMGGRKPDPTCEQVCA